MAAPAGMIEPRSGVQGRELASHGHPLREWLHIRGGDGTAGCGWESMRLLFTIALPL